MNTPQEQLDALIQRVDKLETNFNKNEYTNLSVFLKKVLFKAGVSFGTDGSSFNNKLPANGVTTGGNVVILRKLETNWGTQGTPVPAEGELMIARNLADNKMYLMAGISGSYTAKIQLT